MGNNKNAFKKATEGVKEDVKSATKTEAFKNAQKRVDISGKFASLGVDVNMLNTQNVKTAA